ncbi:MAG: hypothetical protein FWD49_05960, partial [Firmicutes bacterium]|nr:hypothetical protein [Bacillota bacterium]
MAKRSVVKQRAVREAERVQKELEDTKGFRRQNGSGYNDGFSIGKIKAFKLILLALMPIAFFLYSVLLLPIALLYGILYFPVKRKERDMNYGLKKEFQKSIPKMDSAVALSVVAIVLCLVSISAMTTGTQSSVYAGKSEAQIYEILLNGDMHPLLAEREATRIANSGTSLTRGEKFMFQSLTLL